MSSDYKLEGVHTDTQLSTKARLHFTGYHTSQRTGHNIRNIGLVPYDRSKKTCGNMCKNNCKGYNLCRDFEVFPEHSSRVSKQGLTARKAAEAEAEAEAARLKDEEKGRSTTARFENAACKEPRGSVRFPGRPRDAKGWVHLV